MRYLSLFSGIEAATQAFHHHGWEPAAFAEIEAFPAAVLKHHYPNVPNLGDVTKHKDWKDIGPVDLICGGSPCQSFSVAGLRKGMDDPRGNLTLTYLSIVDQYRPKWIIYENVPGLLSSNRGRDFGSLLGGMAELGYGWAYRVLDAQHVRTRRFPHAVPQRRRRVFVVGYLGDWRRAAAVLFDRESLSGHPAPRREAGKGFARGFECGPQGGSLTDLAPTLDTRCKDGPIRNQLGAGVMVSNSGDVGYCLTASAQGSLDAETETMVAVAHSLRGEGFDASEDGTGRGTPLVPVAFRIAGDGCAYEEGSIAAPITTGTDQNASAIAWSIMPQNSGKDYKARQVEVAQPLMADGPVGGNQGGDYIQQVSVSIENETLYHKGIRQDGDGNASAQEADTGALLRALRDQVGEEAFTKWGLGILDTFQSPEILRSEMHGQCLRSAPDNRNQLDDNPLPCEEDRSCGAVQSLWRIGCFGCSPSGWKPSEQLAGELGAHLSVLPHERASQARIMLSLWEASEGLGILRQALSAVQETWGSDGGKGKSEHSPWAVRRLTPREAERLQGFPDDFTRIPYRNKPAAACPDGPRYKALGNSWAVNCADWIAERIEQVEGWA